MELRGATIAVTGATGFLGRYLVDALLAHGAHVIGVVRNPERVPALRARGVELRRADLAEPDQLAAGFAGADAVVSNAALVSLRHTRREDYERANLQGTANVCDAIARAGVRRVVQMSSVAVYARHGAGTDEDAPQLGPGSRRSLASAYKSYAISKALSEQCAWRKAAEHAFALTTLRPCAIYGAFDANFTAVFKRLMTLPVTAMPAWTTLALVYAGDVADAAVRALERPAAIGRAYNVTGESGRTVWEFAAAWQEARGKRVAFMLPVPLPLTRTYDCRRAETELGWRNRAFVDALRDTFAREAAA